MKTEDDFIFANPGACEVVGNFKIGVVGLQPDFTVLDLKVNEKVMNPLCLANPRNDQRGIPVFSIKRS